MTTSSTDARTANPARWLFRLIASQGLACLILIALMVITYFGTLAQIDRGLVQAQKDYFDSWICWLDLPLVGIPFRMAFPGGVTLLTLLAVNLIVGGLLRLRWNKRTAGIAIVHLGIIGLLVSGLVKFVASTNGFLQLDPGQSKSNYTSFHEWELVIGEPKGDGTLVEHLIDDRAIRTPGEHASPALPFTVRIDRFIENARPRRARTSDARDVVDGFYLEPLERTAQASANTPGVYVDVLPRDGSRQRGLLWGLQRQPWTVRIDGVPWTIDLRRRVYDLPYAVRLEQFRKEEHPGVTTPRHFSSDVTKIQDGTEQKFHIAMNRPMRDGGFMLSQNNWGPQDGRPGPYFTVLEVSSNPADQWPKYMCYVIAFGFVLHFGRKLLTHVRRQRAKATAAAALGLVALFGGSVAAQDAAQGAPRPRTEPWPQEILDRVGKIPVQEGGRIKPLATFAGFQMLGINGKRTFRTEDGETLTPVAWLLDCWFFPEQATHYRVVTVDDLRALESVGMDVTGRERRDRYSLTELDPVLQKLGLQARRFSLKPSNARTALERQVMTVARRASQLKYLVTFLDFARKRIDPREHDALRDAFAGRESISLLDLVAVFPKVRSAVMGDPHDPHGEKPNALLEVLGRTLDGASAVALLPPRDANDEAWRTPETVMTIVLRGDGDATALDELRRFEPLVAARGDFTALGEGIAALESDLVARASARGEYDRVELEVSFYRMDWFYRALCCFLLAFVVCAIGWIRRHGAIYASAWVLVVAGELLLVTGIVIRCLIRQRPPITTPYEAILFIIAVGVLVILFIEWIRRNAIPLSFATVVGSLGLVVAAWHERIEGVDTMQPLVAVLDTNFWLATHVTTVTLGYCGGLLAALVAHVTIFGRLFGFRRNDPGFYRDLGRITYGILGFGVVFATVGTILGGVWANDSWGRFWGWDPKENGALMLVLGYIVILHARMGGHIKDHGMAVASVLLGIIVMWAFWGVNLYQVGLHSYGFTETKRQATDLYYAVEGVVALIGLITPLLPHVHRRDPGPA